MSIFARIRFIPERWLLQLYPPFFFMGVKVRYVSPDYREIQVELPARWYGKNMHGTLFGGFIAAVSDPLPTLLCERIFPGVQAWTRRNSIEFLRPARGGVSLHLKITDQDVESIKHDLDINGQVIHSFEYGFRDQRGHLVAHVLNAVYLRRKARFSVESTTP